MRGEIFNIDNKNFFTFGGAKSHDIQEGILNLDEEEKYMNIEKEEHVLDIRDLCMVAFESFQQMKK